MAIGNLPPFEERGSYGGFFPALLQTWTRACFRPSEFFESVGNSQNLTPALLFGLLFGWIGIVLVSLGVRVFPPIFPFFPLMTQGGVASQWAYNIVALLSLPLAWILSWLLFGWFLVLIVIVLSGLITHLFLRIFGGANQGLKMTLRVISYSYAPQIFVAVPCFGCIALIWALVLEIIGLTVVHRTDTWRAALAVIIKFILCYGIGFFYSLLTAFR